MVEQKVGKKKKKIVFVLAIVFLLFGAFLYFYQIDWQEEYNKTQKANNSLEEYSKKDKDTDGDTLLDWEENVRGTNPQKKDTDGDGTNDDEEVRQKRDPLVKAPDDALETLSKDTNHSSNKEKKLTEKFAKEVFYKYIVQKKKGAEMTKAQKQNIVDKFANKAEKNSGIDTKRYSLSEIKTFSPEQLEEVKKYRDSFAKILKKIRRVSENEFVTYRKALSEENPSDFEKLERAAKIYQEIAEDLISLKVPEKGKKSHLNIINSFLTISSSVSQMSKTTKSDPIGILTAINNVLKSQKKLKSAFEQIHNYFSNNI